MQKNRKRLYTAVAVVVIAVIALSVALRLVLTRERLESMLVPRLEKAAGAEIGIGDIGVRFPFGFGVKVTDLTFEKKIPEKGTLTATAAEADLSVSLLSLLRRRPEIGSLDLGGAGMVFEMAGGGRAAVLEGIEGRLSMQPEDSLYSGGIDLRIASARLTRDEGASVFGIDDISVSTPFTAAFDMSRLVLPAIDLAVGGFFRASCSLVVSEPQGEGLFSASLESADNDIAGLIEYIGTTGAATLFPGGAGDEAGPALPVEIVSGTFSLDARVEGSASGPSDLLARGDLLLEDVRGSHAASGLDFEAGGRIGLEGSRLSSEGFILSTGSSSLKTSFSVELGEGFDPDMIELETTMDFDLADLAAAAGDSGLEAFGKCSGTLRASGLPVTFAGLFPGGPYGADAGSISRAWQEVRLEGRVSLADARVSAKGQPLDISGLDASVTLSKGDIPSLEARFTMQGRPWSVEGSAEGIMPCMAEMALLSEEADAGEGDEGTLTGSFLDSIENAPRIALRVEAEVFDARPFQDTEGEEQGGEKGAEGQRAAGDSGGGLAPAAGILLIDTNIEASVDSVITGKAVFTSFDAVASVDRGVLRAERMELDYAGGRGSGTATVDLRSYPRVETNFDLTFSEVQADRALMRLHEMGTLVRGDFSFKAEGRAVTGPQLDPLSMLSASGDAVSKGGVLDLTGLFDPVTSALNIDLSALEKVDFRNWAGSYRIRDGRLATEDWKIVSSSGVWDIAGSFGFDGSLDYRARLVIPPAAQNRMEDLRRYGDLVDLFKDQSGNIVLDFDIGGTAKSPKVALDQSAAKEKAGKKLIDSLREGAADKLRDLLDRKD